MTEWSGEPRPRFQAQVQRWLTGVPTFELLDFPVEQVACSRRIVFLSIAAHCMMLVSLHWQTHISFAGEKTSLNWVDPAQSVQLVAPLFDLPQASPNRGRMGGRTDREMIESVFPLYAPSSIPSQIAPAATSSGAPSINPDPGPPLGSLGGFSPQGTGGTPVETAGESVSPGAAALPFDLIPASNSKARDNGRLGSKPWLVVGNASIAGGGTREGHGLPPAPAGVGSSIELLSDPHGMEFRPFLTRVLSILRRSWAHVQPPAHAHDTPGEVSIEFAIHSGGAIAGIRVSGSASSTPLARWAVYGIQAASGLPSVPAAYGSQEVQARVIFRFVTAPK